MTDAIMALAIVLILLMVLTVAVSRQRRGGERLADSRAALRLAEATITALQTGGKPPAAPDGMSVTVRPAQVQPGAKVPDGTLWVDVNVTYGNARTSSLCGLVRADAAQGAIK
jgi:type II secretory pathway pseudopilin PulG